MKKNKKTGNVSSLPYSAGWIALVLLVFWDAFITYKGLIRFGGTDGNPLWSGIVSYAGPNILWFLALIVLLLFYGVVVSAGWYIEHFEHTFPGRRVILTTLVIAFATYDVYITFFLPAYGFLGSRSHYYIIPVLIIPVITYMIFVEYQKRKNAY